MDPLTIAIVGGAIFLATKKKSDKDGDFTTVTNPSIEIPKPGEPNLKIDKVKKLLNRVDYTFSDGNISNSFSHKWKGKEATKGQVGKYIVSAITLPELNKKGKMDFGPVQIIVQEPGKPIKFSKRINVNKGTVLDIK